MNRKDSRNEKHKYSNKVKLALGEDKRSNKYWAYRNSWTLDTSVGFWTLYAGLWTLNSRRWTLDPGRWTFDAGRWTLNAACWTLHFGRWGLGTGHYRPVSDSAWLNYWKFFGQESLRTSWSRLLYRDYRFWRGYFYKILR